MPRRTRRTFSASFETKVALAAIRGQETVAGRQRVRPAQRLNHAVEEAGAQRDARPVQPRPRAGDQRTGGRDLASLRADRTAPEELDTLDFTRPPPALTGLKPEQKKMPVVADHPQLSVRRQCRLPGLARSTPYHRPQTETAFNGELMRWIDRPYL